MVTGTLADMIEAQYKSVSELTEKLSAAAVGVQGSGWAWLGYDKVNKRLAIATCANQVRSNGWMVAEIGSLTQCPLRCLFTIRRKMRE